MFGDGTFGSMQDPLILNPHHLMPSALTRVRTGGSHLGLDGGADQLRRALAQKLVDARQTHSGHDALHAHALDALAFAHEIHEIELDLIARRIVGVTALARPHLIVGLRGADVR